VKSACALHAFLAKKGLLPDSFTSERRLAAFMSSSNTVMVADVT